MDHDRSEPAAAALGPLAAVAAWLVPGLGHLILGQRRRAAVLCASILILWLTGWLIGGISVFDRKDHPMWFWGQALVAPSIVVNFGVQRLQGRHGPPQPDESPAYEPSFGRVAEQGILYSALAGMLNLLAMIDAATGGRMRQAAPSSTDEPQAPPTLSRSQ